jgi:flavin reductase (DIM6/NTAB) family NADH-FMN oxidoreductase RutF
MEQLDRVGRAIEPADFRALMARVPTSVSVVAGFDEGVPVGLTVGTFVSVSLDPPLVSFCAGRRSESWPRIRPGGEFSVSILAHDQHDVCGALASKERDKFGAIDWSISERGLPIIGGAVAHVECRLETEVPAGDHTIVLGRVLELRAGESDAAMVFHARRLRRVGGA